MLPASAAASSSVPAWKGVFAACMLAWVVVNVSVYMAEPVGNEGASGEDGVDGAVGPTGPTGPQGPAGPAGLAGEDAAACTPCVNGSDGIDGPQGSPGPNGTDGLNATQLDGSFSHNLSTTDCLAFESGTEDFACYNATSTALYSNTTSDGFQAAMELTSTSIEIDSRALVLGSGPGDYGVLEMADITGAADGSSNFQVVVTPDNELSIRRKARMDEDDEIWLAGYNQIPGADFTLYRELDYGHDDLYISQGLYIRDSTELFWGHDIERYPKQASGIYTQYLVFAARQVGQVMHIFVNGNIAAGTTSGQIIYGTDPGFFSNQQPRIGEYVTRVVRVRNNGVEGRGLFQMDSDWNWEIYPNPYPIGTFGGGESGVHAFSFSYITRTVHAD